METWRHFLACHDWSTCTHGYHVQRAKERARTAKATGTILGFAAAIHDATCDMWAQSAHGGVYVPMAIRHCGAGALRHIVYLANQPALIAAWEQAHGEATLFDGGGA